MQFGAPFKMPVNLIFIKQMALSTIRAISDAIVELVTNSDDSYRRLGERMVPAGRIEIFVERVKGGKAKKLGVKDYAEGMNREQLQKAITFSEPASGFEVGRSVRGLFGRGLKEAIVALGEGEITTIRDGFLDKARIWTDPNLGPMCSLLERPLPATEEIRREVGIEQGNGTKVTITVTNEEVNCPDYKTLKPQVMNHYALRDINTSKQRKVELTVQDWKMRTSSPISYYPPEGKVACQKSFNLPGFGERIDLKVWESSEELENPRHNPFARAGLLIKTEGAILDLQLFRYEAETAASYFFGEVVCQGLATRLKTDKSLINSNRGGLEWQRHPYCQALQTEVEKALAPLVEQKKRQLEAQPSTEVSPTTKRLLDDICRLLNKLATREEAEGFPTFDDAEGDLAPHEVPVDKLAIKPDAANIEQDTPRVFSVYAPQHILSQSATVHEVQVQSDNPSIQVLDSRVVLHPHPKYSSLSYGRFRLVGRPYGEEAWITATLGGHEAQALVRVALLGKRGRRRTPTARKGGFITDIVPNEGENPIQRVKYDEKNGSVEIYIRFPVVAKYLGPGLKGSDTPQGATMLAELVGEAFCREMGSRGIKSGKYPYFPGAPIDSFNSVVNQLQFKYLHQIHALCRQRI